jgi:hypothetical protein
MNYERIHNGGAAALDAGEGSGPQINADSHRFLEVI